ncbi:MAG: hypothetical protein AAB588_06885 [Patescibacteria group bacterium]
MHAISVKELREKFPTVRSELKKGESFLIIYKSKPIAELKPVDDIPQHEEASDKEIEQTAASDWMKEYPPLSKEEVDYYLSLKPFK